MAPRKALVIFDSRYGNTARIAQALARGLRKVEGLEADVVFAADIGADQLETANLLVIGGPTEYLSASPHIHELFQRIAPYDVRGKFGFAFDTHAHGPVTGSAARYIEQQLKLSKVKLLEPRQTAWTEVHPSAPGAPGSPRQQIELTPGMEEKFEGIGSALGREFLAAYSLALAAPESEEWKR